MPSAQPEGRIVKRIIEWINNNGGHARKVSGGSYGRAGEPDVDACLDGRAVKIEVKQPGRALASAPRPAEAVDVDGWVKLGATPLQARRLEQWQGAGAVVGVAASLDDALAILHAAGLRQ